MIKESNSQGMKFRSSTIYKIVDDGKLNESWSDRLGGMQIKVERKEENQISTTLIGEIKDQAALSGVLNSLYDLQMAVISVTILNEIPNN